MRTQISTNVSGKTRQQADELIGILGYSLRDVVSIAIDRLYREEVIDLDKCPHGLPIYKCEKCAKQIAEFQKARKKGDLKEMERLSQEMRKDHSK